MREAVVERSTLTIVVGNYQLFSCRQNSHQCQSHSSQWTKRFFRLLLYMRVYIYAHVYIMFIWHDYTKGSNRQTMSPHEPKPSWAKLYSFIQLKCIDNLDLMAIKSRFNELCLNSLCVQTTNLSFHLKALRRMFFISVVCVGWCEWNPIMLYYGKFTLKTFNGSNILTSLHLLFLGVHCPCKSKSQAQSFLCVAVSRDQSEQHWKLILEEGMCMFRWCAIIKWHIVMK